MDAASDFSASHASSPLSSPPSSVASSPLSSARSSPSPPPDFALPPALRSTNARTFPYPSPPASQQTSYSSSPVPDGMESGTSTDKDGPPPAKRRRTSKERSTEYLDLRHGEVEVEQQPELDRLLHVLYRRQKIVVIAGAGISVSAGIPDFRSSAGLFRSLKEEHKLKGSGRHLFDASVYKDDTSTSSFHDMVSSMSRLTRDAQPTAFHHMLATLAREDRLLRLYSQNVDGIDTSLAPLRTRVPLRKDAAGKWPRTVQLHGGLDKMVCSKCHEISDFDADLFAGATPPLCRTCEEINEIRTTHEGKRSHGIGRLRPRMVLYNEHNPDDEAIGTVTREDLRRRPDAVIVVGTTLKVPGVRRIVREMCGVVRDRRGGVAIWINNDLPPVSKDLEDCFDIVVQGTCDEVACRAAMRRWDEPAEQDRYEEVSAEASRKAGARTAEVHLPLHSPPKHGHVQHLPSESLPSALHYNNSFSPPPPDSTPKKPHACSPLWSPMSSQAVPSIEDVAAAEGENIIVVRSADTGLLTPTKGAEKTRSPLKKAVTSITAKLMAAGKKSIPTSTKTNVVVGSKKPSTNTKSITAKPKKATANVKFIKSSSKTTLMAKKSGHSAAAKKKNKPQQSNNNSLLTTAFKQSKAASSITAHAQRTKKNKAGHANSPSKLREVVSASSEPMHPLSPQDRRNNSTAAVLASPSPSKQKPRPMFPGLVGMSENAGALAAVAGERKRKSEVLDSDSSCS